MAIAVHRTGDPWAVAYDEVGLATLVARLDALTPALIVMEATGGLERFVAVVNPRHLIQRAPGDFARATGTLAKTDALDACILAHVAQAIQSDRQAPPDPESQALTALSSSTQC